MVFNRSRSLSTPTNVEHHAINLSSFFSARKDDFSHAGGSRLSVGLEGHYEYIDVIAICCDGVRHLHKLETDKND